MTGSRNGWTMSASAPIEAVFLDRDGVLNVDHGYVHDPADLDWIPGAREAVSRLTRAGIKVLVVTNQSGVARRLFTIDQMHGFNDLVVRRLGAKGARIGAVYACPFHSDGSDPDWVHPDHPDRKPNPGMILRAIEDHNIDPARSFLIGDRQSDLEAAQRAGIRGFLFTGGNLDDFVAELLGA